MSKRTTPSEFLLPLALLAFAAFWFHAVSRPAPLPPPPPVQTAVQIELPPSAMAGASIAPYERGTQQWPLIVDFADTPGARQRAADEAARREHEAADSRRILLVCGLLAVVGFIQFLALIVQAYWMKQWVQNRGPSAPR
jgi:hypothetical protein